MIDVTDEVASRDEHVGCGAWWRGQKVKNEESAF